MRPPPLRANAAAYFSAARAWGVKSVGKRMFLNGYITNSQSYEGTHRSQNQTVRDAMRCGVNSAKILSFLRATTTNSTATRSRKRPPALPASCIDEAT